MIRSIARAGGLLAVFAVLSIAYTYPLSASLAHSLALPAGSMRSFSRSDAYLCPWIVAAGARALATAPTRLFDANMFHPAPLTLATSENMLGYAPLAAPVFWLTGNALLSAHVAMLGSYAVGGLGMYLLVRLFAGRLASLVAALAYVFAPWRLPAVAALPHLATHWFPFVVLATERALASGRRRDFAAVAGSVWANAVTTLNYGVAGFLIVPVHALVRVRWIRQHPARAVGLAASVLVAAIALLPVLLPYVLLAARGILPPARPGGRNFPVEYLPQLLGTYGIPPIALAVLVAGAGAGVLTRHGRRQPGWPLGVALVTIGCVLALGRHARVPGTDVVIPMPLALLDRAIPALESLRVPMRFVMVAGLGLVLMLGLAVDRLLDLVSGRRRIVAAAAIATLIGAELAWRRASFDVVPVPVPSVYAYLREHGAGRPLLEVPIGGLLDPVRQGRAVYFSTYHWLPLLNGFASHRPPGFDYLEALITRLPDVGALQNLVNVVDVGWIVVRRAELLRPEQPAWNGPPPAGLRHVGRFGDDDLYEVRLQQTKDLREPFRRWYADPRHETFSPDGRESVSGS